MLAWSYFPKTDPLPDLLKKPIQIFEDKFSLIDSSKNDVNELRKNSDEVLKIVSKEFIDLGYEVETGKKRVEKVRVPVLFSHNGDVVQAFEVDGWHTDNKIVF